MALAVAGLFLSIIAVNHKTMKVKIGDAVFDMDVATTMGQKTKGLAGRLDLADTRGMIFLFDEYGNHGFWMAGMKIPIDILWIKDDVIVGIEPNVPFQSTEQYYPPQPVNRVIELKAGIAAQKGIKIGDIVHLQ